MKLQPYNPERYNAKSREYIDDLLKYWHITIIGTYHKKTDTRGDDYLFFKWDKKSEISVAVLALKDAGGSPCNFGDLEHLAKCVIGNVFGWSYASLCPWYDWRNFKRIMRVLDKATSINQ